MKSDGLIKTDLKGLKLLGRGKVRDIYELTDYLLIIATDRISAYDVIMPDPIPGKGKVLTRISEFWFKKTEDIIDNHLVTTDVSEFPEECFPYRDILEGRSMLVKKATPLPVECIVRGYLSGSGWEDYCRSKTISGIRLPDGLKESSMLPEPIFAPSTKEQAGRHDISITRKDMENIVGHNLTSRIIKTCIDIYERALKIARRVGIIIADTKMEFGIVEDKLTLIDELLTPDSSRFWIEDDYEEGRPQKSFDKQFLRDYLTFIKWDRTPPAPKLPQDVIKITREKYEEAMKRLVK